MGGIPREFSGLRRGSAGLVFCVGLMALATTCNGAPAKDRPADHKRQPPEKPWIDAKDFCLFPLERDALPRTGGQLTESMLAGWRGALTFPDASKVVEIQGGRYPAVDTMFVDLSGASTNSKLKSPKVGNPSPTARRLAIRNFAMTAEPLVSRKANLNVRVTGRDMRFDLQHDADGKPILMLADAAEAMFHFDVSHDDLQRMMLASAHEMGASRLLGVKSLELEMRNTGPRSLLTSVHLRTVFAFVPAGLRFTAKVDVDDKMNARISGLTCDGDDVLGPLIGGLIRPFLARYEGKTRPLLTFPGESLKLHDVQLNAGERVDLTARFGR